MNSAEKLSFLLEILICAVYAIKDFVGCEAQNVVSQIFVSADFPFATCGMQDVERNFIYFLSAICGMRDTKSQCCDFHISNHAS